MIFKWLERGQNGRSSLFKFKFRLYIKLKSVVALIVYLYTVTYEWHVNYGQNNTVFDICPMNISAVDVFVVLCLVKFENLWVI